MNTRQSGFIDPNYDSLTEAQREVADKATAIISSNFKDRPFTSLHFLGEDGGMETEFVLKPLNGKTAYVEGAFIDGDATGNYAIRIGAEVTFEHGGVYVSQVGGIFNRGWQRTAILIERLFDKHFKEA